VLYRPVELFCHIFALAQVGILILEFGKGASTHRKADTVSSVVFWLGLGYLLNLLSQQVFSWLSFVGAFVVLAGVSIVVKELIMLAAHRRH
jgi:hypothetical protein